MEKSNKKSLIFALLTSMIAAAGLWLIANTNTTSDSNQRNKLSN